MDNLGTLRCISRVACTQSVKLPVRFVISALVFLLIYITEPTVAVEFKCSACEAVASELQSRLNKEVPRNHLDMRHRLDGNGNRYGKMIPYKESELRVHDLLDGLCGEMEKYVLIPWNKTEGRAKDWIKVLGEGRENVPKEAQPGKAEAKAQRRSLESYCAATLDEIEEDLSSAIRGGRTDTTSAYELICKTMTNDCKPKKKSAKAKEDL